MKISEIIESSSKPVVSLEIVPPLKGISRKDLLDGIRPLMEFDPAYINVTNHRDEFEYSLNSDGSYTRHLVRRRISEAAVCAAVQAEFKVEVVPHLICGGVSAEEIESELHDFRFLGMNNVLALRGDCIPGERRFVPTPGGYSHASELVSAIRGFETLNPSSETFCIGVGAYPEKHFEAPNIETDIRNLKRKIDAGADYVITQMFFDNAVYFDFVDRCRKGGINVPIIPALKPISSAKQLQTLPEAFSLNIPHELSEELEKHSSDRDACYRIGQEWCAMQCRDLLEHGVKAVHFYTMGKASNVIETLRECF